MKTLNRNESFYELIAKLNFVIYLIVLFFNTSLPFREKIENIEEISISNPINQIIFSLMFLIALVSLIPKLNLLFLLVKKEKILTILLIWSFFSIFWSEFSFVSFKRWFQIFTAVLVCSSVLLHVTSTNEILKLFKIILSLYIFISMASVLFIPGAIDTSSYAWRGLAQTKNLLGQAALINVIFWFNMFKLDTGYRKKYSFLLCLMSLILLFGTISLTSIITLYIIFLLGVILWIDKSFFRRHGFGWIFSIMIILFFISTIIITYYSMPEYIIKFLEYFGKDNTFTGRTNLWIDIFHETKRHLLVGCGFNGFWVVDNPVLLDIYDVYTWLPNQSHMGYLDLLNELGIIGFTMFLLMVIFYFKQTLELKKSDFWKWFFLAALIINFQESTLFKPRHYSGVMLIFAYLTLYVELLKNSKKYAPSFNKRN